jgi:hypothetical protein
MREVDLVVGNAEREEDAMRPDADGANPVLFPLRNLQPSVVFQETEVTSTWSTFAPAAPPPAAKPKPVVDAQRRPTVKGTLAIRRRRDTER